ncbi:MAG: response regulator, partial [Sedimentibacter sp.]
MKNKVVNILILEDSVDDAEMVVLELKRTKLLFTSKRVDTEDKFLELLENDEPDIIISDYYLPSFNGLYALELVKKLNKDIPVIIITGSRNEEVAMECIENGAKDYVFKEHLARLGIAVFSCLEQKNANEKLKQNYELLKKNFEMLIETMARVIEIRDPYTAGHQKRVAKLAVAIGKEMLMDAEKIE